MGLLDGSLDPQSMSVLALAGGLLSPGSFGQGLSRGIQGQQQVLGNAQEMRLREQQIAAAQQEQQVRELSMQRTRQQLQFGQNFLGDMGGGAAPASAPSQMPAASAAMGQGASMGSVGPTPDNAARLAAAPPTVVTPQQQSRLASLTQDQVAAGVVSGVIPKEFVELWTNAKFGRALPPGWKQNLDGSMVYVPDPNKGVTMGPDGKTVQTMPGATDTLGALAAATKGGEMRATNQNTPVPLDRLDRMPGLSPTATLDDLISGGRPPAGPMGQLSPTQRTLATADMRQRGLDPSTMSVNGMPVSGGGFKTPADLAAESLRATQGVRTDTDPILELRKDMVTKSHAANQASLSNMADITNNEAEIVGRNNRLAPLLAQLPNVGGFASDHRIDFANKLKQAGIPDSVTSKIAGGDPEAAKVVANQLSAAAIQTMLDTLNKEGKPNRVMYQALKEQQEGLDAGKNVLAGVMKLQQQLYDQHREQLGSMTDLMSSPDYNPIKFQNQFATAKAAQIATTAPAPVPTMRWNAQTGKIEAVK